jgi:head-tail adaptor
MTWQNAFAELNASVVDYFGESVDYLSLDGLTAVNGISATLNRGGEDGDALFNMPVSSVAVPAFGDRITDGDAVAWRISDVLQPFSDRTPCNLKRSDFWYSVDLQYMKDDTEVWDDHTTGIISMINTTSSNEVISADDGHAVTVYEVKVEYLTTPTRQMRFKWVNGAVTRYLYIQGRRDDESHGLTTIYECVEEEA